MDFLRELALPTLRHRTDTSVQPFAEDIPASLSSVIAPGTLRKKRVQPIHVGVHPFSDYASQSVQRRASTIVQPFTDDRPPDSYLMITPTTKFKIGKLTTSGPLVNVTELKGHIALLYAFSELKKTVEASDIKPFLRTPSQSLQDAKWTWFVGLAVERFDVWCRALKTDTIFEGDEKCLPPIDVLMVWHAYMLNPRWYAEDTIRIITCKRLRMLEVNFTAVLENPTVLDKEPSDARTEHWRSLTALPFDPIKGMYIHTTRLLKCPCCRTQNEVELGKESGTGYLQHNFIASCSNAECSSRTITKAALAHRELAWDITATSTSTLQTPHSRLAGTVFPKTSILAGNKEKILSGAKAHQLASNVDGYSSDLKREVQDLDHEMRCKAVMKHCPSLRSLQDKLSHQVEGESVQRVMSAYIDDKAYSIDLVEAVLNQSKFVQQISDLGWTRPDYFYKLGDDTSLHHALSRYHSFLDLSVMPNVGTRVPTLDIDLVWHTHQLMPTKYYTDVNLYLKRFLDHGMLDIKEFSSALADTSQAWRDKFNVPYAHCGCTANGASTNTRRLSQFITFKPKREVRVTTVPHTISATHPSDHNVNP